MTTLYMNVPLFNNDSNNHVYRSDRHIYIRYEYFLRVRDKVFENTILMFQNAELLRGKRHLIHEKEHT